MHGSSSPATSTKSDQDNYKLTACNAFVRHNCYRALIGLEPISEPPAEIISVPAVTFSNLLVTPQLIQFNGIVYPGSNSRLAQESHTVPILFLNECDQLLLRRVNLSDTSSGGDKVDNAVSNMFLEQMESLDGIMICTTNCVKNLDNAFERRFLFKIELGKPDAKTRNSIWKSNFPTLSDEIIESLSKGYEFSGGQIENVTRKALIDQAISGIELSLQVMQDYCSHESYAAVNKTKPIGWGIQESCCLTKATTG